MVACWLCRQFKHSGVWSTLFFIDIGPICRFQRQAALIWRFSSLNYHKMFFVEAFEDCKYEIDSKRRSFWVLKEGDSPNCPFHLQWRAMNRRLHCAGNWPLRTQTRGPDVRQTYLAIYQSIKCLGHIISRNTGDLDSCILMLGVLWEGWTFQGFE